MASPVRKRRLRQAPPEPRVRRIALTDADYVLFEALERHGPLPSSYLYEFTRHLRRDRSHLQNRLTEFYNGDATGSYLTRPPQQFASFAARYQHVVYDLAPNARRLLAERGKTTPYARHRSDPFVHRLMTACASASFELGSPPEAVRYIGLEEICGRQRRANPDRGHPLALLVPGQPLLIPDLLFGLEFPGAGYRFFAVECDRNTESIERTNLRQSSFGRKITSYVAALDAQAYRRSWGLPNLHVLTLTTNLTHADNILRFMTDRVHARHHQHLGVAVAPSFGIHWSVPTEPMFDLISSPWRTPTGWKHIARADERR